MTMHQTRRIPIVELNDYLTCKLCKGYFIDATTIIECLHTFCRSCIVKCLEENKYCPVCDVQVHKTKPLLNIRPDKTLQDIVYKLVPGLFQDEMCRRREFYATHQEAKPTNSEQCGEASYDHILSPAETICLSLNYHGSTTSPRYLRCSAAVSVMHLQKLLRSKYDLSDHHRVDVLYNEDCLNSRLALMDIAYMYLWKRKGPLELTYRIYENVTRKLNLETSNNVVSDHLMDGTSQGDTKSEWKEVQLRISENGEMCFTGIDDTEVINNEITNCTKNNPNEESEKCETDTKLETKENLSANEKSKDESQKLRPTNLPKLTLISSLKNTALVNTTTASSACTSSTTTITTNTIVTSNVEVQSNGKHKLKDNLEDEPCAKQAKPTILNNLSLHNLSNNHPLKRHSQVRKSVENDVKVPTTIVPPKPSVSKPVVTTQNRLNVPIVSNSGMQKWPLNKTPNLPCYVPKTNYNPIINVPKASTSRNDQRISVPQAPTQLTPTVSSPIVNSKVVKSKPSNPIGYKTLRDPPKTWNPQISRASLLKSPDTKFGGDLKNIKPAKFFKMRNNIPRYLGNPASGVKPLYQVHNVVEKEKGAEATKPDKMEIKKHSIVKIDPKTLKPITEKAPEISNLTNQVDLKINTSSVPIFNHLKLQSSPKNERKSPKSPQSPKSKTSPPPNKREKLNLSYTPPNPFIPNLGNPTLSPNQFLYPTGIPNLHSYDPRLVAAYHNYLYGQPLQFPPNHLNLNLDLNKRKTFETSSAPASPIFKCETKNEPPSSPKSSISPKVSLKNNLSLKRTVKESSKHEKSLQNALEKLTQNRVKELTKLEEHLEAANHQAGESIKNGKIIESDSNVKSNGRKMNHQQVIKSNFVEESSSNKCGGEKKQLVVTKTDLEADEKSSDNNTNVSNNNNNTDSVSLVVVDANKK